MSLDEIFDLTAGVYFHFYNNISTPSSMVVGIDMEYPNLLKKQKPYSIGYCAGCGARLKFWSMKWLIIEFRPPAVGDNRHRNPIPPPIDGTIRTLSRLLSGVWCKH